MSTIFLVDDDTQILNVTARLLMKKGWEVETFDFAEDVLELLSEEGVHVDVLITDQEMFEMLGTELAEKVRQDRPELPIVVYSSLNNVESPHIDGFIEKGNIDELVDFIQRHTQLD